MPNAYQGQYTSDPEYASGNPYDPDTQPEQFAQWNFQHQGPQEGAGEPFRPGRIAAMLALAAAPYGLIPGVGTGGAAAASGVGGGAAATPALLAASPAAAASAPAAAGASAAGATAAGTTAAAAPAAGGGWAAWLGKYGGDLIGLGATTAQYATQRNAVNNARDAQTQAGRQAIQTQQAYSQATNRAIANSGQQYRDIYNQQVSNLSPYTSLGAGAASTLGGMLGIPVSMPQNVPLTANQSLDSMLPSGQPLQSNPNGPRAVLDRPLQGVPFPNMGTSGGGSAFAPHIPQPGQATSQTVKMKAPDGSIEDVPANLVPHYQSLGASVVQS